MVFVIFKQKSSFPVVYNFMFGLWRLRSINNCLCPLSLEKLQEEPGLSHLNCNKKKNIGMYYAISVELNGKLCFKAYCRSMLVSVKERIISACTLSHIRLRVMECKKWFIRFSQVLLLCPYYLYQQKKFSL